MGSNLPPGVSQRDIERVHGYSGPEPKGRCPHCSTLFVNQPKTTSVFIDREHGLRFVNLTHCPDCGEVIYASLKDTTEEFLESWRTHPEDMIDTIDHYSELREIAEEVNN